MQEISPSTTPLVYQALSAVRSEEPVRRIVALALTANGPVTAHENGTLAVWKMNPLKPEQEIASGLANIVALRPIGKNHLFVVAQQTISLWLIPFERLWERSVPEDLLSSSLNWVDGEELHILCSETPSLLSANYRSQLMTRTPLRFQPKGLSTNDDLTAIVGRGVEGEAMLSFYRSHTISEPILSGSLFDSPAVALLPGRDLALWAAGSTISMSDADLKKTVRLGDHTQGSVVQFLAALPDKLAISYASNGETILWGLEPPAPLRKTSKIAHPSLAFLAFNGRSSAFAVTPSGGLDGWVHRHGSIDHYSTVEEETEGALLASYQDSQVVVVAQQNHLACYRFTK